MAGSKPEPEVTSVGFGPDGKPGPNTHHLVHYETQQISVDNNGIIHPVPMIRPQDVDDVCVALQKAKEVGLRQQEMNRNDQAKAAKEIQPATSRPQRKAAAAPRRASSPRAAAKALPPRAAQKAAPAKA